MTRTLTFNVATHNQQRFRLLYEAILLGGQTPSRGSGIDVLRKEAAILDALDAVSDPPATDAQTLVNGDRARQVRPGEILVLAQHELDLLKKRLEDGPWLPQVARQVVDVVDWCSAAPEHLSVSPDGVGLAAPR